MPLTPSQRELLTPLVDVGLEEHSAVLHFGQAGGVLPRITDLRLEGTPEG